MVCPVLTISSLEEGQGRPNLASLITNICHIEIYGSFELFPLASVTVEVVWLPSVASLVCHLVFCFFFGLLGFFWVFFRGFFAMWESSSLWRIWLSFTAD
jgi:hypothetical protein